ncbi:hypothetical protein Cob_v012620 [Colletotrichum orbiculare MAFF 240422]|uniref:Uncharacterized protein n=1 Tax=Colletotrichum orbiculare (strain 104-T / ATCC 96160 / CBS 514.97 / LARS 414 / MAFF 240422) TaxID=1213857 RepID=A0A484FBT6_COLOR|nr:hypothetical protein Cob_v012620 [Colletotrichum orbiculare MAFF 240422]
MSGRLCRPLLAAFVMSTCIPTVLAQDQFRQFFPGWSGLISDILKANCSDDVSNYAKDPAGQARWDIIDCVLTVFSESRKAEAAAAALTFGLAPMVLQAIGPSTCETSLLFLRRPLLALLLSIASPWPSNSLGNAYDDPETALQKPPSIRLWPGPAANQLVSLLQYALAAAAAANVAVMAYQLGYWSFFASANNTYDPVLWTYTALLIHIVGIIGILLRFEIVKSTPDADRGRLTRRLRDELTPTAQHKALVLRTRKGPALVVFLVAGFRWLLSIAPTLQVLYGTISLSGSLLTSQQDARNCLFRYVGSAVVARALLSYELAGLRDASFREMGSFVRERQAEKSSDASHHGQNLKSFSFGRSPPPRAGRSTYS